MTISEDISVLLRLLIAHLLTDFALQPSAWIRDRREKKFRSGKLYLHCLITAALAYVFSGLWQQWWIPVVIFITHVLIDAWKASRPEKLKYFIADQLLHLLVVLLIWIGLYNKWNDAAAFFSMIYSSNKYLAIISGYLMVTWPLGIMIGIATEKWRNESGVNSEGLDKAGLWIGLCERFLILTFILIDQYTAVGLLIAAKSILRFNDHERNTQKKTEYVLIGTLMSYSTSVLLGWLMRSFIDLI